MEALSRRDFIFLKEDKSELDIQYRPMPKKVINIDPNSAELIFQSIFTYVESFNFTAHLKFLVKSTLLPSMSRNRNAVMIIWIMIAGW